jgi:outer membrane protein assembly factor BamA
VRAIACLIVVLTGALSPAAAQEVVVELRVQGNTLTPDQEIFELAGVAVGMPMEAATASLVAERLRATDRFESVEVLKRFATIADPTKIVLVLLVDEGPVRIEYDRDEDAAPRVRRARGLRAMILPLLGREDGYGFTYGARLTLPDAAGPNARLSFPLTWGGERRAAVELERSFSRGPLTRLQAGAGVTRRTNPFYEEADSRRRLWVRAEREITRVVRVGAIGGWERAAFGERRDRFFVGGADVVVDTRIDPLLARNAVYARVGWDRFAFLDGGVSLNRTELEGRGYVGLIGQTVLIARALRTSGDQPLPEYLKPLLGGAENLRGFAAGTRAGDTLVAGSLELRVPLTSPLSVGKLGISAFVDVGTAYSKGERLRDRPFERGVGGSVWFSAAVVRLNLAVARGLNSSSRVHFGTGLLF